jgi:CheY-like chemotaxis protein
VKVLDIAPDRSKRQQFAARITDDGHDVFMVPGRREALDMIQAHTFDLMLLDAMSDLYDTRELVEEMRSEAENEPVIAVFVEPRNRPPRHRLAGRASNVIVLQDGSVDHMARMIHLALSVRGEV